MSAGAIPAIAILATGILLMRFCKRWLAKFNIAITNRINRLFRGWPPEFGILARGLQVREDPPNSGKRLSSTQ